MTTLMIDAGPAADDALVSRTGGVPLAPAGTSWPTCATCGGPLQFLAQLLLADLAGRGDLAGSGEPGRSLLALFACQNDPGMCDDWEPDSGGNLALLLPVDGLQPIPRPEPADAANDENADEDGDEDEEDDVLGLGATRAVELCRMTEPDYYDARTEWAERTGRPVTEILGQLGGTPDWLQGDETPGCPDYAQPMPLAVQLEPGPDHLTAMNFGDGGNGYGFACEPCGRATFLWQC
ncbi:DUF1963 domain-containing protein [Kitasatospora sp. LaBMicrA B282]|uniref:DUF1963 domain-containing protein n=1 Tax=Kitasatospora sp. LaBMicrA B282 TaxID=3420949 RepID=UPI003D0B659C